MSPFFPHAFWVVGSRHTCPPTENNSKNLLLVLPASAAADAYNLNVSSTKHSNCKTAIWCRVNVEHFCSSTDAKNILSINQKQTSSF